MRRPVTTVHTHCILLIEWGRRLGRVVHNGLELREPGDLRLLLFETTGSRPNLERWQQGTRRDPTAPVLQFHLVEFVQSRRIGGTPEASQASSEAGFGYCEEPSVEQLLFLSTAKVGSLGGQIGLKRKTAVPELDLDVQCIRRPRSQARTSPLRAL